MREITDHKTNAANGELTVMAEDAPGSGGAHHVYSIAGFDAGKDPEIIQFQNGPIKEAGVNGLTHEVLLAIVIDRLRSFQAGKYVSAENDRALYHCQEALASLKARTEARLARGVEGTHKV